MGYVNVTSTAAVPTPRNKSFNVACVVGKSTGYVDYSNRIIEQVTSVASLSSYDITSTTAPALVNSLNAFFQGIADGGGSGIGLTVAIADAFPTTSVSKNDVQGVFAKNTLTYSLQTSPVSSVTSVYMKLGTAYIPQPMEAWTATQDANGLYTGEIVFNSDEDARWAYASDSYMDPDDIDSSNVYASTWTINGLAVDYTLGKLETILNDLIDKEFNFLFFSYDPTSTGMGAANTHSEASLLKDYLSAKYHCSNAYVLGKRREFIGALPKGVVPTTLDTGFGFSTAISFENWPEILGGKNQSLVQHDVTIDSSNLGVSDPAAFFAGKVVSRDQIRRGFVLDNWAGFPQTTTPTPGQKTAWDRANIACVFKMPNYFTQNLLSTGYTLDSSSVVKRIEGVRAQYWVEDTLTSALLSAIASHTIFINKPGCLSVEQIIRGVLNKGVNEGVCDGLDSITFPLLDAFRTPNLTASIAAISTARTTLSMGTITVKWVFAGNVETININLEVNT